MARSLRNRIRSWPWWKWGLLGIVAGITLQGLFLLEIWREHWIVDSLWQKRVSCRSWRLVDNTPLSRISWIRQQLHWLAVVDSASFPYEVDVDPDSIRRLRSLPFLSDITFGRRVQEPLQPAPPAGHFVTDQDLEIVGTLTQLRTLSFNYSNITDSGLQHLVGLQRLCLLDLKRATISDQGLRHVGHLQSLRHLNLQQTQVTGTGFQYLHSLPRLSRLSLQSTPLRHEHLAELARIPSLRNLDLDLVELNDDAIPHLSQLTMLKQLSLTGLTDEGFAQLQKELPNCRVLRGPN